MLAYLVDCLELVFNSRYRFPFYTTWGHLSPGWARTCLRIFATSGLLFLYLAHFAVVVLAQLVKRFGLDSFIVFKTLAASSVLPTTCCIVLSLSRPRQISSSLGFPFVEPPATISGWEFGATLRFDKLDVISANAAALDELFLLLIPSELPPFLVSGALVAS